MGERSDIYQRVTGQIIEAVERGAERCRMPWHVSDAEAFLPMNAVSKRAYRGVNVLLLWAIAETRGYPSQVWATYEQWQRLGAQVRGGEKSACVVFWKFPDRREAEETSEGDGSERRGHGFFARGYSVFNAAQVEGYTPEPMPELPQAERVETAERFFANLGADIRQGGNGAYYQHAGDYIRVPRFEAFPEPVAYYSTLAHECTHWTAAKHRLDRDLSGRFGSHAYAAEELVAELGAAFICATLKLSNEPRPDHAAYISNWLQLFRDDKRAIFTAASKAQQAADFMHAKQSVELAA